MQIYEIHTIKNRDYIRCNVLELGYFPLSFEKVSAESFIVDAWHIYLTLPDAEAFLHAHVQYGIPFILCDEVKTPKTSKKEPFSAVVCSGYWFVRRNNPPKWYPKKRLGLIPITENYKGESK